ncbi:hypothetical protein ABI59_10575 [Acidobacteria bacterium Mor1]|nr:hypothetical protein ABI59_10575 [Acidobacteria bacterium Mor1]
MTKDAELVERLAADPDGIDVSPRERALLDWALKVTRTPWEMTREDLQPLKEVAGLDDRGILDLSLVTAYFAFVNRLADSLGVEVEPGGPPHATRD